MKLQIPAETQRRRGQYFPYLLNNFDCIIINDETEVDPDRTVVWGTPFDNYVHQAIKKYKLNYFYMDNGYIGNWNYKKPWYVRICYNNLQNAKLGTPGKSRIHTLELDGWYEDWNSDGEYNLFMTPLDNKFFSWFNRDYTLWRAETIARLESTGIPLVVRDKPGGRASRSHRFTELPDLIRKAKKVITHHSIGAVEAMLLGKPVEILGVSAVQHWQNKFGFDRTPMLEHIAHCQFSRDELEDGTAWKVTFDYQLQP